jgi:hypothetical protein
MVPTRTKIIRFDEIDNVAVAVDGFAAGESDTAGSIIAKKPIPAGQQIRKQQKN